MNSEQAQKNMIDSQIKTWDVFGARIIEVFEKISREKFVPNEFRELAFADCELDLGNNFKMNSPKLDARILQAVDPQPCDNVLEIGTGTGFLTALLSNLSNVVYSIEIDKEIYEKAQNIIKKHGFSNIRLFHRDGLQGHSEKAPFDIIIVSASSPSRLLTLEKQLAEGGRMLIFINETGVTTTKLISRQTGNNWQSEDLFETTMTPLVGLEPKPQFEF